MDGSTMHDAEVLEAPLVDPDLAARIEASLPPAITEDRKRDAIEHALLIAKRSNPYGIDVAMMIREDRERDYYNDHLYPWD